MNKTRSPAEVRVRQYTPADHAAVAELFVEGMFSYEAHQNDYNEQYVASCLRDDLADIESAYFARGGNFWVATLARLPSSSSSSDVAQIASSSNQDEHEHEVVVGMVGLERSPNGDGELRRLSVRLDCQGLGIGRLLVSHLEQWARANGIARVNLCTGVVMPDAMAFYAKLGYRLEREEPESDEYMLACFSKPLSAGVAVSA